MSLRSREVIRYVAVGLANTIVGLALIYLCMAIGLGDVLSNATGYAVGLVVSFVFNGMWTFGRERLTHVELGWFGLVVGIAYLTNLAVMLSVRDALGWSSVIGQAAGVLAYALVGFVGMKFFVFRMTQWKKEITK